MEHNAKEGKGMRVKFYITLHPVIKGDHILDVAVAPTIRKGRPKGGDGVVVPIELDVDPALFQHPVLQGNVTREKGAVKLISGKLAQGEEGGDIHGV